MGGLLQSLFQSTEVYLDRNLYVAGFPRGNILLPTGISEYRFSFEIPNNCPSTFEGKYGRIEYFVKAKIDSNVKKQTRQTFTLQSLVDLNRNPSLREPRYEINQNP